MEARKITVIQTKGQGKTVFMSGAEKLGELKSDLRENKIPYDDMIFYEGISRTELVDDQSILPKDIPFKGQTTNELIIYLTLKNKKIRSGMAMTRSEAYAAVKDNNLGDAVKAKYGKNFTQVSTSELESFITDSLGAVKAEAPAPVAEAVKSTDTAKKSTTRPDAPVAAKATPVEKAPASCGCSCGCKKALETLVNTLAEECVISDEQAAEIIEILGSEGAAEATATVDTPAPAPKKAKLESSYSDSDLNDLAPRY